MDHYSVIIIGGGQAGLSISYCLKRQGVDHVIFEKHRIAESWRSKRWDTFCLVTPNWQCRLPGHTYSGPDPNGFMKREEIVEYIESYARRFAPPVREGVAVSRLFRNETEEFEVETSEGNCTAVNIVVATGGYHQEKIPRAGGRFPESIFQIHSSAYRNPGSLPDGEILVVGTGQSGCQIAEDLHLAGRKVHLCVGGAPRTARRYRGKDVVEWLDEMGYYDKPVHEHPLKERVRARANHYVTGRDGGRDIDLRRLATEGMRLYGRLLEVRGVKVHCADDLQANLDQADAVSESIKDTIDRYINGRGIEAPHEERYRPLWQPDGSDREIDLQSISTVIWCVGYKTDYSWIELPLFDGKGYPMHDRGVSAVSGVYFLGLPWLYTWGSGRFSGIARDAEFLTEKIRGRRIREKIPVFTESTLNEWALGS